MGAHRNDNQSPTCAELAHVFLEPARSCGEPTLSEKWFAHAQRIGALGSGHGRTRYRGCFSRVTREGGRPGRRARNHSGTEPSGQPEHRYCAARYAARRGVHWELWWRAGWRANLRFEASDCDEDACAFLGVGIRVLDVVNIVPQALEQRLERPTCNDINKLLAGCRRDGMALRDQDTCPEAAHPRRRS